MADLAAWDESTRDQQRPQTATVDQLNVLARRADQLPLMQHALNQLWREAKAATKRPRMPLITALSSPSTHTRNWGFVRST